MTVASRTPHVVVVGAGVGGLTAAVDLARQGLRVTVLERAHSVGGKMRQVDGIDAGPTVFTMKWVFDKLFEDAGSTLAAYCALEPLEVIARHAWSTGGQLDVFADVARTADAIGRFANAKESRGFLAFCARSAEMYETLRDSFIAAQRPSLIELIGRTKLGALRRTMPFSTLWHALGQFFEDPRLRQLFARYSTYVGASPFEAPATLMLVTHVEQSGLWRVAGGMHQVAIALQKLGEAQGAAYRFGLGVACIETGGKQVHGVVLENGERLAADAVVFNGDVSALATGLLGDGVSASVKVIAPRARSLSALTWCFRTRTSGFRLSHHNVFFTPDYRAEFKALFHDRQVTQSPTVYLSAQDRDGRDSPLDVPERLMVLINAPADGDGNVWPETAVEQHCQRAVAVMRTCGLELEETGGAHVSTSPANFERLFPATGGSLYGRANHGPLSTFERGGSRTGVPGLYCVGGSVHPGAGVPMVALSGRLCAASLLGDLDVSFRETPFVVGT